jgi:hypothetical protein
MSRLPLIGIVTKIKVFSRRISDTTNSWTRLMTFWSAFWIKPSSKPVSTCLDIVNYLVTWKVNEGQISELGILHVDYDHILGKRKHVLVSFCQ